MNIKTLIQGELFIDSEADIVSTRQAIRGAAKSAGFGITDTTRIVTAASELARNIYNDAQKGNVRWRILEDGKRQGLEITFEDRGPGIANIEQAMQPGYSSSGGLGMGLPGAQSLMDEFNLQSKPGQGTVVCICKWRTS